MFSLFKMAAYHDFLRQISLQKKIKPGCFLRFQTFQNSLLKEYLYKPFFSPNVFTINNNNNKKRFLYCKIQQRKRLRYTEKTLKST